MFTNYTKKFVLTVVTLYLALQTAICFAADPTYKELLVTMKVNYEETEDVSDILINQNNEVFMPFDDLKKYKVNDGYLKGSVVKINDGNYINLSTLKGTSVAVDQANLSIDIKFPTNQMPTQNLSATTFDDRTLKNSIKTGATGAFLNYNFTANKSGDLTQISGTPSFQYFNKAGNFQSSFLVSNHKIGRSKQNFLRLDTAWTSHNIKKMAQWRIGDSITKASDWSGSTRFLGVQYATDFSVRPDLVPFPLANFVGQANLPSTVDVYLKSLKVYSQPVKEGPFVINNLPVTTGNGNVVIETQDITGKRTTVVLPYYVAPSLLKKGLSNYSFEAGTLRDQYSQSSSKYKFLLTNADYTYGITDFWTSSAHFETLRRDISAGFTNIVRLGDFGVVSGSIASNFPKSANAQFYNVSYSYQTGSFSFNTTVSSAGKKFTDTLSFPPQSISRPKFLGSFSYNSDRLGEFFIVYTTSKSEGVKSKRLDFSYDKAIVASSFFRFSLGKDLSKKRGSTTCLFSLNMVLGEQNSNIGVSNGYQGGIRNKNIEISSPVSKPIDWGYRVLLQDNKTLETNSKVNDFDIGVSGQNSIGTASFRTFEYGKNPGQELFFSGSVVAMNNAVFLAPPIQQSLALVKVGTLPNIPIYYNNQIIGKTNTKGLTLAPNVVPYVPSQIKVDDQELPLDMSVPSIVQTVAPPAGGGVVADFKVRRSKGVELRLLDDDKEPVFLNYSVKIDGIKEELFIGYNGLLYIENISNLKALKGKVCDFQNTSCCNFNVPVNLKNPDPIISIGDTTCHYDIPKPKHVIKPTDSKGHPAKPEIEPTQPKAPGPNA